MACRLAAAAALAAAIGAAHVAADSSQSSQHIPTYIWAVFPPDGALYFETVTYWSPWSALLACFAIFVGVPIAFFGLRLHRFLKVAAGAVAGGVPAFLVLQALAYTPWWINGFLATIAAFVGAWAAFNVALVGLYLLGFFSGFLLVATLWTGFVGQFWNEELWFQITSWVLCMLAGGAAGVPGLLRQREGLLANSSLLGAYLVVAGMDFFSQDGFAVVAVNMFFLRPTPFFPIWLSLAMFALWLLLATGALIAQIKITALHFDHRRGEKRQVDDYALGDGLDMNINL